MRLTFLTHFPGRGGSTVFLQQLREFFERRGHSTEVVCGTDASEPLLESYHVVPAIPHKHWRERRNHYLATIQNTRPDIVYAISGSEEFDVLRFLTVPRVHHIFSLERHPWMDVPRLIRKTAPYTELFTANTPDVLDFIAGQIPKSRSQLAVAPYKLDASWFDQPPPTSEEPEGRVRVCYCARLEPNQKRAHWLAEIIPAAERRGLSLEWHIIGEGPCEELLRARLSRQKTPVKFHGWLTPDQVRGIYRQMDLFFLCSRWEGLPIAMVEAMACGLACLVPRIPSGIVHLLEDGRAGWMFEATSPSTCVQALTLACANQQFLRNKKLQSARIARETHSPSEIESLLLKLEDTICHLAYNRRTIAVQRTRPLLRVSLSAYLFRAPIKILSRCRKSTPKTAF